MTMYEPTNGVYLCVNCSYSGDSSMGLCAHRKKMHPVEYARDFMQRNIVHKCTYCTFVSIRRQSFRRHLATHESANPKCTLCPFSGDSQRALWVHYASMHAASSYTCEHCEYTTTNRKQVRRHQKYCAHDNTNKHESCSSNGSSTHTIDILDENRGSAESNKTHRCGLCSFTSHTEKGMTTHYIQEHSLSVYTQCDIPGLGYKCSLCSRICKNKRGISIHYNRSHRPSPTYICEYCGHVSTVENQSLLHKMTCRLRDSKRKQTLPVSQSVGGSNSHYNCKWCRFIGADGHALAMHNYTVHSTTRFKCKYCDYTTNVLARLRKHQQMHCCYCGYLSSDLAALNVHSKNVHHIRTLPARACITCGGACIRTRIGETGVITTQCRACLNCNIVA